MSCRQAFSDDVLADYARGGLGEDDRRAVEDHFFDCPTCLDRLETLQALPRALRDTRLSAPATTPARAPARSVLVTLSSLAAAVLIVWIARPHPAPPPDTGPTAPTAPPADPVSEARALGAFAAPAYHPIRVRSTGGGATFAAAMRRYGAGEHAAAAEALERAVRQAPREPGPRFFLGVSQILAGRVAEGAERLRETIALGESPYREEARYYLAKARLLQGRPDDAARELAQVVALGGGMEAEARELLARVERLQATPAPGAPFR